MCASVSVSLSLSVRVCVFFFFLGGGGGGVGIPILHKSWRRVEPWRPNVETQEHVQLTCLTEVALFRFLLILVLACHWLACVWAMTLKIVEEKGLH